MADEYVYEKLIFFNIKASKKKTGHVLLPKLGDVFAGKLPKTAVGVPLLLDLGAVDPKLKGRKLPFFELPFSIGRLDLKATSDGRFTIVLPEDLELASIKQLFELIGDEQEEPFASSLSKKHQLRAGNQVEFVRVASEAEWGKPALGWCPGEGVYFCQGTRDYFGVDGPEWLYAGCIHGSLLGDFIYGFYNRKTRGVRLLSQNT